MSKGNRNSTGHLPAKSFPIQTREKPPIPIPTKGGVELHCPFCDDHHLLLPGQEYACGTKVEVMAVQEVISNRLARAEGLVCVKCHKVGGDMVRYRNSFVHLANCSPDIRLLQEEPRFSFLAKVVHNLPPKVRGLVERLTGRADQVLEIDATGEKTGKVRGYFFWKESKKYAKHPAVTA